MVVVHEGKRKEEISGYIEMNENVTLVKWDTVHAFGPGRW